MTSTKKHLNHLETVGLIKLAQTHPELEFMFRHALVQEAAYNSLLIEDRKKLHRQVGEAIEEIYPDQLEEFAAVLGNHFEIAGDEQRALKYFSLAGEVSSGIYANAEAVSHYAHALKIIQRGEASGEELTHLYTRLGRALELTAQYTEALRHYKEMESLALERQDQTMELAALMAQATILNTTNSASNPEQGQALLEKARILAHQLDDQATEAKILWNLMLASVTSGGDPHQMIEFGEQSLALARQLNLREQMAFTLLDLWWSYSSAGQWPRAQQVLDEGRDLWRELDNLPLLALNLSRSSNTQLLLGDYEQAITYFEEALHVAETSNNQEAQAISLSMTGLIYLEQGQPDKALSLMERAITLGEELEIPLALVGASAELAWIYGQLGSVEQGLNLAHQTRAIAEEKFPFSVAWPRVPLIRLYLLNGNITEAEAIQAELADYHDLKRLLGSNTFIWIAAGLAAGELAFAKHDYPRTIALMDDLLTDLRETTLRYLLPDALLLKSRALIGQDKAEEALETLAQARTEAETLGSRRMMWQILATTVKIEVQRGNEAEAQAQRQQAREIIQYIADHTPKPELRSSFLNLPEVQMVLAE